MASPTTLLMGRHLKRTPQAPDGPSPCFPRAMPAPSGEGSHPALHAGCSWFAPCLRPQPWGVWGLGMGGGGKGGR